MGSTPRSLTEEYKEEAVNFVIEGGRSIAEVARNIDRAWLGGVAALEESLRHLRQRQAEAEQQLQAAPEVPLT